VHASTHIEEVCNEVDKTSSFNTPLEPSYEADSTSAYDGHVDCTHDDHDELHMELSLAHSSSFQSSMEVMTHEDVSDTYGLMEELLVMVEHEEHSFYMGLMRGMA
jgi:hypothetical protein